MSDFAKIAELVTQGQQLLDSIKGGAIRTMQTAFDELKASIASEWNSIKNNMNNEALAAIGRVDTETVIADMGFTALNYNDDQIDLTSVDAGDGTTNVWPIGVSWSAGVDMNRYIKAECMYVHSGDDPATRPEVVKSLLDMIGIGRDSRHFARHFNILKMTLKELPTGISIDEYLHLTFDYRIYNSGGISLMKYRQSPTTTGWVCDKDRLPMRDTGQGYHHWNMSPFQQMSEVGAEMYMALPTVCAGLYPESKPLVILPNLRNSQVRGDNVIKALGA